MIGYIILMSVGFLVLLLSFLASSLFDFLGDFAGGEHDVDIHVGGHEVADVHTDGAAHVGPSFFNIRVLSAFVTGFGAMGYLLTSLGWNAYLAALPALGVGAVMAAITYGITLTLFRQQGSSSYTPSDIVGQEAEISVPIPPGDAGQIALVYKGQRIVHAAKTRDGAPIPGGLVRIDSFHGGTAIVSKV